MKAMDAGDICREEAEGAVRTASSFIRFWAAFKDSREGGKSKATALDRWCTRADRLS